MLLYYLKKELSKRKTWNAREEQKLPEGDWNTWMILAGRGFGKTRTGAESVRILVEQYGYKRVAIIGQTIDEALNVMVKGVSGLLTVYERSKPIMRAKQIFWSNGAVATIFGGDQAEKLRGPEFDLVWIDELAKFKKPEKILEQLAFCLRLGQKPRMIITTTPKPYKWLKDLTERKDTFLTRGSTFANPKLSQTFLKNMQEQFANTRIGEQELNGQIIPQEGLWNEFLYKIPPPDLCRIIVAVDPAVTNNNNSAETGILVAGIDNEGNTFVLADLSGNFSPAVWSEKVIQAYHEFQADKVIAEVNHGGDLVENILRSKDRNVCYKSVRASKGKFVRAEPVAALYQQQKIFHKKKFPELEMQLLGISQYKDRMDALVWAVHELCINKPLEKNIWVI